MHPQPSGLDEAVRPLYEADSKVSWNWMNYIQFNYVCGRFLPTRVRINYANQYTFLQLYFEGVSIIKQYARYKRCSRMPILEKMPPTSLTSPMLVVSFLAFSFPESVKFRYKYEETTGGSGSRGTLCAIDFSRKDHVIM